MKTIQRSYQASHDHSAIKNSVKTKAELTKVKLIKVEPLKLPKDPKVVKLDEAELPAQPPPGAGGPVYTGILPQKSHHDGHCNKELRKNRAPSAAQGP